MPKWQNKTLRHNISNHLNLQSLYILCFSLLSSEFRVLPLHNMALRAEAKKLNSPLPGPSYFRREAKEPGYDWEQWFNSSKLWH